MNPDEGSRPKQSLYRGETVLDESSRSERRKNHRLETDQVISFADLEQDDRSAVAKSLSGGGIGFETVGTQVELGDVLRVTFRIAERRFEVTGKVVWVTATESKSQEVGLEFEGVDPECLRLLEEAT
jgi:Tfp pilus assembly protein PilZ